jgi:hypothetical protein
MQPIIRHENGRITAFCPYCNEQVFEPDDPPQVELSCYLALGVHLGSCKQQPDYVESEVDQFMSEILELTRFQLTNSQTDKT